MNKPTYQNLLWCLIDQMYPQNWLRFNSNSGKIDFLKSGQNCSVPIRFEFCSKIKFFSFYGFSMIKLWIWFQKIANRHIYDLQRLLEAALNYISKTYLENNFCLYFYIMNVMDLVCRANKRYHMGLTLRQKELAS